MDDFPQFPVPPRAFDGGSRQVEADACFDWLRQGWAIFAAYPGVWIACAVLVMVMAFGLSMVPLVGHLAANLLAPIIAAGLLHLCRRQAQGAAPQIGDLFIGFKDRASSLMMVGVIFTVGTVAIAALVFLVAGGGMAGGVAAGPQVLGLGLIIGSFLLAGLLMAVLSVPLLMALWFAPALVFFHAMAPAAAMKASFHACLKNWLPFLVFGLILFILCFLAALPLLMGFLVLIPVLSGALYASYRDIFVAV